MTAGTGKNATVTTAEENSPRNKGVPKSNKGPPNISFRLTLQRVQITEATTHKRERKKIQTTRSRGNFGEKKKKREADL